MQAWLAGLVAAAGVGLASEVAGAAAAPRQPLQVSAASVAQDGRMLVWRVRLVRPFSPGALATDHRTLCLLIRRPASDSVAGQLCVAGRPRRDGPALRYERVTAAGPGPARSISAAITRSSSSELVATFLPAQIGIGYLPLRWQVISTLAAPPCTSPARGRSGCYLLFPRRSRPLMLHTPRVVGCVPGGPSKVFSGPSGKRQIALTFDDGPGDNPPARDFVDLLAREHVPATFFVLGTRIPQLDPDGSLERAMLAHGDMIGEHSWTHPSMTHLSRDAQRTELERGIAAIRQRTGFTPCMWRPPYGDINEPLVSLARSLGMLTIMWDVDPNDWRLPGADVISRRVVAAAHNGAIVVEHFGGGPRSQTLRALPQEIAGLRSAGYRFVTVDQLLGLRLIYR